MRKKLPRSGCYDVIQFAVLKSHSHRGFSPVTTSSLQCRNRFNGLGLLYSLEKPIGKPLKRFPDV